VWDEPPRVFVPAEERFAGEDFLARVEAAYADG